MSNKKAKPPFVDHIQSVVNINHSTITSELNACDIPILKTQIPSPTVDNTTVIGNQHSSKRQEINLLLDEGCNYINSSLPKCAIVAHGLLMRLLYCKKMPQRQIRSSSTGRSVLFLGGCRCEVQDNPELSRS